MKALILILFSLKILTVGSVPVIQAPLSFVLLISAVYLFCSSGEVYKKIVENFKITLFFILLIILFAAAYFVAHIRGFEGDDSGNAISKFVMFPTLFVLGVYLATKINRFWINCYIVSVISFLMLISIGKFYSGGGAVEIGGVQRLTGFVSETDLLANLASFCMAFCVSQILLFKKNKLFWFAIILSIIVLLLSATLKNIFIVAFYVFMYMYRNKKISGAYVLAMSVFLPAGLIFVDINDLEIRIRELFETGLYIPVEGEFLGNSMNWRILQWNLILSDWYSNYFYFGVGLGNSVNMDGLKTIGGVGYSVHNDYISFLSEMGLIGFLLFIYLHVKLWKLIDSGIYNSDGILISYAVLATCAFFGPMYYTIPWLYVMPFIIGANVK